MALFVKLLIKRKSLSMLAILFSGLTVAVTLCWNAMLSSIINKVSAGQAPDQKMVLQAIGMMLIMGLANFAKSTASGYACESITHDLRMNYAHYFASRTYAEIENLNTGEQLSKLQNEIAGVSNYLNTNLYQLLDDAMKFLATIIWLLFQNPVLTLASQFPSLVIVAYIFYSSRIIGAVTERSLHAKGQMNRFAETLLALFPMIRLYDASRMILDSYRSTVKSWEQQTVQSERIRARLMSLSALLSFMPLILILLIGGRMAINSDLTIGTLYFFINLSGNVSGVLMNMPGAIAAFRQFAAAMKRLSPQVLLSGDFK